MSSLDDLRNEVKRRQKAVSNKISRIKRNNNANVAGTKYDPRRKTNVNKYNRKQLETYLANLNDFMRRGNQFVGDAKGVPITRGAWAHYKKLENEVNAAAKLHDASIGNINLPNSQMTIADRKLTRWQGVGMDAVANGPYGQHNRMPGDINGPGKLQQLAQKLLNQLKPGHEKRVLDDARRSLYKAFEKMGEQENIVRIAELSDYQLDALWNGTAFAEAVFVRYEAVTSENKVDKSFEKDIEDAYQQLESFFEWASELPSERPGSSKSEKIKPPKIR